MMNDSGKLSCNIIKDLLPSYLEDICSADTKHAVEGHLSECSDCRALAAMMRETDFVLERTESSEIDYMKKTRRHLMKKGTYGGIALAVFVLLGLFTALHGYHSRTAKAYFMILPCLLIFTKALLPPPSQNGQTMKSQKMMAAFGILLTLYGVMHNYLCFHMQGWNAKEYGLFHMKPDEVGPFLYRLFLAILSYHTIMYLLEICRAIRGKPASFLCMSIYLTGGFLILGLIQDLKDLSDFYSAYHAFLQTVSVLLLEGIAITAASCTIEKLKRCCSRPRR